MCIKTGISLMLIFPLIFISLNMTSVLHSSRLGRPNKHASSKMIPISFKNIIQKIARFRISKILTYLSNEFELFSVTEVHRFLADILIEASKLMVFHQAERINNVFSLRSQILKRAIPSIYAVNIAVGHQNKHRQRSYFIGYQNLHRSRTIEPRRRLYVIDDSRYRFYTFIRKPIS